MSGGTITGVVCTVRRNDPSERSIAVWDGRMEMKGLFERERWTFLPRDPEVGVCVLEPKAADGSELALDDLDAGQTVTLGMPEWLAKDRGLI